MRKASGTWILSALLALAASLTLWNCNLGEIGDKTVLALALPDSLSQEQGKYDSIIIVLLNPTGDTIDASGKVTGAPIFDAKYDKTLHAKALANIELGAAVPNPLEIRIIALKGGQRYHQFEITVSDGRPSPTKLTYVGPIITPDNTPTSVDITSPSPLNLFVGDAAAVLHARVLPEGVSQEVVWTLDGAAGIVEIVNGTQLRILKAGTTRLKVASVAKPSVSAILDVKVAEKVVNPTSISLLVLNPMYLAARGADGDLSVHVLPTGASQAVAWTSSDTLVARITPEGKVRPLKAGKSTLTVRSVADPAITATLSVEVISPIKVDGNIYTNTLNGVTLRFPDSWSLKTDQKSGKLLLDIIALGPAVDGRMPKVNILTWNHSGTFDWGVFLHTVQQERRAEVKDFGDYVEAMKELNRISYAEIAFTGTFDETRIKFNQYFILNKGRMTCVTFGDLAARFDTNTDFPSIKASLSIE